MSFVARNTLTLTGNALKITVRIVMAPEAWSCSASFVLLCVGASTSPSTTFSSKLFSSEPSRKGRLQPIKAFASDVKQMFSKGPINFYSRSDPYYYFTNFYPAPIQLDGHQWPTTEHYFQGQKFVGTPYYHYIRTLPTPREAFQVSRIPQASEWIRGDWMSIKNQIMLKALRAKFSQNEHLKQLLLDTKERKLVEHTTNDSYWGDGGDGSGQNQLGKLLMQVRRELKDTALKNSSTVMKTNPRGLKRSNSFSNLTNLVPVSSPSLVSRDDSDVLVSKARQTSFASPMTSRKKFVPRQTTTSQYASSNYKYSSQPKSLYSQVVSNFQMPSYPSGASASTFYGKSVGGVSSIARSTSYASPLNRRLLSAKPNSTQRSSEPTRTNASSVGYNIISNVPN